MTPLPSNEDPVALTRTAAIFRAARQRRLARIDRETTKMETAKLAGATAGEEIR